MVFIRTARSHRPYAMYSPVGMNASNSALRFYGLGGSSLSTTEAFRAVIVNRELVFLNFNVNVRGNSLNVDGLATLKRNGVDIAQSEVIITAGVTGFYDSGEGDGTSIILTGGQIAVEIDGTDSSSGSITAVTGSIIFEVTN